MANTYNQKELKTKWPITSGLIAGSTKQKGRRSTLVPERGSLVPSRKKIGV